MKMLMVLAIAAVCVTACGKREGADGALVQNPRDAASSPAANPAALAPKPAAEAAGTTAVGPRELVNPDDYDMALLYAQVAKVAAPVAAWVADDTRVRTANEFDKAQTKGQVEAEFAARAQNVKDVGHVQLRLNSSLSGYSATYGEYTVKALSPGQALVFRAGAQQIELSFDNALEAQRWKLSPDAAKAVLDANRDSRGVTLQVRAAIVGAAPGDRGNGRLRARVKSYEILGHTDTRLGSVEVEP